MVCPGAECTMEEYHLASSAKTRTIHQTALQLQPSESNTKLEDESGAPNHSAGDIEAAEEAGQTSKTEVGSKHDDRPKGIRFALLFSCLLLGNLFAGYVCLSGPEAQRSKLTMKFRIAAAS